MIFHHKSIHFGLPSWKPCHRSSSPSVPGRENFGRHLPCVGHLQSLVPWLSFKKKGPPTCGRSDLSSVVNSFHMLKEFTDITMKGLFLAPYGSTQLKNTAQKEVPTSLQLRGLQVLT